MYQSEKTPNQRTDTKASLSTSPLLPMSTDKQFRASSKHDEVPAALLSTEDASLSQSTLSNSPRQADEPPSEATTSPKASPPDKQKQGCRSVDIFFYHPQASS